jgi:hypothetical protein
VIGWLGFTERNQPLSATERPAASPSITPPSLASVTTQPPALLTPTAAPGGLLTPTGTATAPASRATNPVPTATAARPILPKPLDPSVPRQLVEELARQGTTATKEATEACIERVHKAHPGHTEFAPGQRIPAQALIATDFLLTGRRWSEFPVRPLCHRGDWGLFESRSAFDAPAPYRGAFWPISPR